VNGPPPPAPECVGSGEAGGDTPLLDPLVGPRKALFSRIPFFFFQPEVLDMFITIDEGKRGLFFRSGRLVRFLRPGRHFVWSAFARTRLEIVDVNVGIEDPRPDVVAMLPADEAVVLDVPIDHVALVTRMQRPFRVLGTGRFALWPVEAGLGIDLVDLRPLDTQIPAPFWPLAAGRVTEIVVRPFERVLVWVDGALDRVLEAGRHGLSTHERKLEVQRVEMREQELQVVGQELITKDKVTLRLNLVVKHRVIDPVLAVQTVHDLHDALYAEAQLVARAAIAGVTVDELLERRADLTTAMVETVAERARAWGVEIRRLEIKDVVLPGEMKTLLNQVIEADKRAAAQNILRREEVAATRQLANTARLLENNPVLRRLKEMEAVKEIADRIDKLTVIMAPADLHAQLRLGSE
jgi:regulator of protease activity HflC (stomatin/prohibitin superfamily)